MARRVRPQDLLPSAEELRVARELEKTQGYSGAGATIGSVLGGAAGAIGFLGGPELGVPLTGIGMGAGGAVGGWLGSLVGDAQAKPLENKAMEFAKRRSDLATREEMRRRALQALINREGG